MGCSIGRRSPWVSPYCRDSVLSIRPTECGSLPTPSQQLVRLRPQRRVPTSHPDEVPKVKAGNRETAALSRGRAYAHVTRFLFFAFTPSPTYHKPLNHNTIRVKILLEILHFSLISRDFPFNNPLFFNLLHLLTTKKQGNRTTSAIAGTTARRTFPEQRFGRRHNAQTFYLRRIPMLVFSHSVLVSAWQPV